MFNDFNNIFWCKQFWCKTAETLTGSGFYWCNAPYINIDVLFALKSILPIGKGNKAWFFLRISRLRCPVAQLTAGGEWRAKI
jgi:hypothetical protein